ncbi:UNVERIFIED_ORG: hypothetical protein EOZ59_1020 [Serratia quinivorans]
MASFVWLAYGGLTGFTRKKPLVLLTKTALSLPPQHPLLLLPCNDLLLVYGEWIEWKR